MTTTYPVPLDNLIAYVKSLRPDAGPLDNLADAITISTSLDEQADALLGYFVDQARRSGASWSQIGANMGVSKQAARKRFVPRFDGTDAVPDGQMFSRLTLRARNALVAAGRIARPVGDGAIDATHLAAGLLSQPNGLAAMVIHDAGISDEQLRAAVGVESAPERSGNADAAALRELRFTDTAETALEGTLTAALRLGHNFIGTEHLLLGVLIADGEAARMLTPLGLTVEAVERAVRAKFAAIQA
ncbi:MAG: Clp protease N-terminal domain-containing protein [Pseudonocardiaceae bacterium]